MNTLKLWFTFERQPELLKTQYNNHLGDRVAFRGMKEHELGENCFRWGPAVQAMTILLLRVAASSKDDGNNLNQQRVLLEGLASSPASSLDYALSKQPKWLLDMFGIDEEGIAIARHLFLRRNSERKRPGPVVIWLNDLVLSPVNIEVNVDGVLISSPAELTTFAHHIEKHWIPLRTAADQSLRCTDNDWDKTHSDNDVTNDVVVNLQQSKKIVEQFTQIWKNCHDEISGIQRTSQLIGQLKTYSLLYLDYRIEIYIYNSNGDAQVTYTFDAINIGNTILNGDTRHLWFEVARNEHDFSVWAKNSDGEPLPINMIQDSPYYKQFLCSFPRPMKKFDRQLYQIGYDAKGMFSEKLYWDIRPLHLTRRVLLSIRHTCDRVFKGCRTSRELSGGFVREHSPDLELEIIPNEVLIQCRHDLLAPGELYRTTWHFHD